MSESKIKDILKPKSEEEIKDLEQRGFRKDGGKWKFTIDIEEIIGEYDESENTTIFRESIHNLLKLKIDDIELLTGEEESVRFEKIVEEFNMLGSSPEPTEIDNILGTLYDWADDNDVWVNSF